MMAFPSGRFGMMLTRLFGVAMLLALTPNPATGAGRAPSGQLPRPDESPSPRQTLIAAGDMNNPPHTFLDESGRPTGHGVDVLNAIAERLNMEVEYRLMPWEQAIQAVLDGDVDIIPGMVSSRRRRMLFDITIPFWVESYSLFAHRATSLQDLNDLRSKRLATMQGDYAVEQFLVPMGLLDQTTLHTTFPEAFDALFAGEADVVLAPYSTGREILAQKGATTIRAVGPTLLPSLYGMAVQRGASDLLADLNMAIDAMKQDGSLQHIHDQWALRVRQDPHIGDLYRPLFLILLAVCALAILLAVWSWALRRQVRHQTAALREREEHLAATLRSIGDGVIATDSAGLVTTLNAAAAALTGWTIEEARGRPIEEVLPILDGQTGAPLDNPARAVLDDHQTHNLSGDVALVARDGAERRLADSCAPITDDHGKLTGVVLVIRDVTDRRAMERALQTSQQMLRDMLDTIPVRVFWKNRDLIYLGCNRPFAIDAGFSHPDEIIGKDDYQMGWAEQADLYRGDDRTVMESGEPKIGYEEPQTTPQGGRIWLRTSKVPLRDVDGATTGVLCTYEDITPYKQAQEALQKSEEEFRALVELTADWIWAVDQRGVYTYVSPQVRNLLGYEPDELIGKTPFDLMPPDMAQQAAGFFQDALARQATIDRFENVNIHRDGRLVTLETNGSPIFDASGALQGYRGIDRDITDRKHIEAALRESEAKFRSIVDQTGDMLYVHDLAGRFLEVNQAACVHTGYMKAELLDMRVFDLHVEDANQDQLLAFWQQMPVMGHPMTLEGAHKLKCGRVSPVEITLRKITLQDQSCILALVRDITERKEAEAALQRETLRYTALMQASRDGIVIMDNEHRVIEANRSFADMLGYELEEMATLRTWDWEADLTPEQIMTLFPGDHELPAYIETHHRRKDETVFPVQVSVSRAVVDDQPMVFCVCRDLTERKRAQAEQERLQDQLLQAQKIESIGRLAGGVAHDFNNMLQVILGHTALLREQIAPDTPISADLQIIAEAAQRSADLTRQLLAFARKQTIDPTTLDLNETVLSMLRMLQRLMGEDIELVFQPGSNLDPVHMDPSQVDQILANLAANARDAIDGVGVVTIETENMLFDATYCEAHPECAPGHYVMLAVSDNGCGMDAKAREHLFEPFYTTKELGAGTGLGLATIYGIVKQNAGFINVYSEPGQGTTFKIYLPRTKHHLATPEPAAETPPAYGDETILLVEDELTILDLGKVILERHGYTVLAAETPEKALQLTRDHDGPIDLLVTDVVMPKMNGKDLARQVHALRPGIGVLFMSGYTSNVIGHHGVLDAGTRFIQKPFSVQTLTTQTRLALDERQQQ